jgi:hypothetical protein
MKNTLLYIPTFLITIASSSLSAQESNIILRAMQDELKRSTTELQYENHQKPFYISYTVDDAKVFSVYASLGGLYGSRDIKTRNKNVRILVGDYEFNDESLDNSQLTEPTANEIEMPLEDDYFGIRRSLWTTTDIVYKGAAQKFKKNQATLKEKNKPLSEIPHRTFAKLPAHQTREEIVAFEIDKKKWEDYCKELSAYFKEIESLEASSVFVSFTRTVRYFVNSEGTTAIVPETIASFHCNGQIKSKENTPINVQTTRYAKTLDELPSFAELQKEVRDVVAKLKSAPETKSLDDEYSGPVMFIGEPVIQAFTPTAFSLTASNNLQGQEGYNGESGTSMENKIGKNYIDPSITIKVLPGLKSFQGKNVIGSFIMDAEGVKPSGETTLVEKGILKNLMNDRSLTKPDQVANGFNDGPGVLQVALDNGIAVAALKEKLIAAAKAEGLDFALIVRGKAGPMGQTELFKVDLATGKEERVSAARMKPIQPKDLKRLSGTSTLALHYIAISRSNVISAIVPEAVLIQEVEMSPFKNSLFKDDVQYITSPLKSESR